MPRQILYLLIGDSHKALTVILEIVTNCLSDIFESYTQPSDELQFTTFFHETQVLRIVLGLSIGAAERTSSLFCISPVLQANHRETQGSIQPGLPDPFHRQAPNPVNFTKVLLTCARKEKQLHNSSYA
jgi:hypothetical protein